MNTEYIDCVKYMYEYYEDPISCYGYVKLYEYFVGEPYNIIISYKAYDNQLEHQKITVTKATEPRNNYLLFLEHKESKLYPVRKLKTWIEDCKKLLDKQKNIEYMQYQLYKANLNENVPPETYYESMDLGIDEFRKNNIMTAIGYFFDCLNFKEDDEMAYYNLACCYSQIDKIKALEYLSKSVENGNRNWNWVLCDNDLDEIKSTTKFQEIIQKMKANEQNDYKKIDILNHR